MINSSGLHQCSNEKCINKVYIQLYVQLLLKMGFTASDLEKYIQKNSAIINNYLKTS